ncbi:MAG: hypothetical protein U5N26_01905 [Candidatus Marinimicrobia bacterium]|nr:hypothetical protein [Candidatus Neomarinimicrobiota bacterium]
MIFRSPGDSTLNFNDEIVFYEQNVPGSSRPSEITWIMNFSWDTLLVAPEEYPLFPATHCIFIRKNPSMTETSSLSVRRITGKRFL